MLAEVTDKTRWIMKRAGRVPIEPTRLYEEEVRLEPGWGYRRYFLPLVLVMLGITPLLSWYGISTYGPCGVCGRIPIIGLCATVYSIGLTLIGIRAAHGISWGRTIVAGLRGVHLPIIFVVSAIALFEMIGWSALLILAFIAPVLSVIETRR